MNLEKAEQAVMNGIYAATAWLMFDFGTLFQTHGNQTLVFISSHREMLVGAIIVVVCIVGLFYKSRLAAIVLLFLFLIPVILRAIQGAFPSTMVLLSLG